MNQKKAYDRDDIRRMNAIGVLSLLHEQGALSRARIAAKLGLTRATVSSIVAELLSTKLVRETSYIEGSVGRPGLQVELNPNSGSMIAVEIDVDCISLVLTNATQEILLRKDRPLPDNPNPDTSLTLAEDLVEQALILSKKKNLRCFGIGVAWAGLIDHSLGELAYGPTSGWEQVPLKKRWEARFQLPIHVENEAHAGALGIQLQNQDTAVQNLIYVSLGVGLAAGIIANGQLLRGSKGFAGQVGHTPFIENGITCHCGKTGCWVTEIGAAAILRKLEDHGVTLPSSGLGDEQWIEQLSQRASEQDPVVLEVLNGVGNQLGKGLARLAQTFNPQHIVVGGRMGKVMCHVEKAIHEGLIEYVLPYTSDDLSLSISDSDEDQLVGCLAATFKTVLNNPRLADRAPQ